jgi:hypothetical protein
VPSLPFAPEIVPSIDIDAMPGSGHSVWIPANMPGTFPSMDIINGPPTAIELCPQRAGAGLPEMYFVNWTLTFSAVQRCLMQSSASSATIGV